MPCFAVFPVLKNTTREPMSSTAEKTKGSSVFEIVMLLSMLFGMMLLQTLVGPRGRSGSS